MPGSSSSSSAAAFGEALEFPAGAVLGEELENRIAATAVYTQAATEVLNMCWTHIAAEEAAAMVPFAEETVTAPAAEEVAVPAAEETVTAPAAEEVAAPAPATPAAEQDAAPAAGEAEPPGSRPRTRVSFKRRPDLEV